MHQRRQNIDEVTSTVTSHALIYLQALECLSGRLGFLSSKSHSRNSFTIRSVCRKEHSSKCFSLQKNWRQKKRPTENQTSASPANLVYQAECLSSSAAESMIENSTMWIGVTFCAWRGQKLVEAIRIDDLLTLDLLLRFPYALTPSYRGWCANRHAACIIVLNARRSLTWQRRFRITKLRQLGLDWSFRNCKGIKALL